LSFVKLCAQTGLQLGDLIVARADSGKSNLNGLHDRPKQNIRPRQCAAQGECDYKNCPVEPSLSGGLSNCGVSGMLILGR
jgi:hypothetical protein